MILMVAATHWFLLWASECLIELSEMLTHNRQKCWQRLVRRWRSNAHLWSLSGPWRSLFQENPFVGYCMLPISIPSLIWTSLTFPKLSSVSPLSSSPGHLLHPKAYSVLYWVAWMYISNAFRNTFFDTSPIISSPLSSEFRIFLFFLLGFSQRVLSVYFAAKVAIQLPRWQRMCLRRYSALWTG